MPIFERFQAVTKRLDGMIRLAGGISFGVFSPRVPDPTLRDERFGADSQQSFDLWLGDPGKGALVFFHGGGFLRGRRYFSRALREAHAAGITVVSAGYRSVGRRDISVENAVEDAAAVVGHLKQQSQRLGIDPARIAVTGNSAGGILALLLAMRHEVIPGCCNRVVAAAAHDSPTAIDPRRIEEILELKSIEPAWIIWSRMFKVGRYEALAEPRCEAMIARCSPELWISSDMSPVYLSYSRSLRSTESGVRALLHSPRFGVDFADKASRVGAPVVFSHADARAGMGRAEFLERAILRVPKRARE